MTEASLIYRMLESSFTLFALFLFFSVALGRLKIAVLTGCVRTQITPVNEHIHVCGLQGLTRVRKHVPLVNCSLPG